jgi:hypothetical protein
MEYGLNKIFVEGSSDKIFVDFLLEKFFEITDNSLVIDVAGKDKLINQPLLSDKRRIDEKAKNLIIFDTDTTKNEGGRKVKLDWLLNLNKEFKIYLLPFNDESEGVLENLLDTCIKPEFAFFDNCWDKMIDCITSSNYENLNIPAQKASIYSKIDLFKKYRTKNWDYKSSTKYDYSDNGIWTINPEDNEELKKLIDFISENLFNITR